MKKYTFSITTHDAHKQNNTGGKETEHGHEPKSNDSRCPDLMIIFCPHEATVVNSSIQKL